MKTRRKSDKQWAPFRDRQPAVRPGGPRSIQRTSVRPSVPWK